VNSAGGLIQGGSQIVDIRQYEQEWNMYRNILNRTNVTKHTKWLDLRGNHGKKKFIWKSNFSILINRYIHGSISRFIQKFLSVFIYKFESFSLKVHRFII
jgi:hypothetical protein